MRFRVFLSLALFCAGAHSAPTAIDSSGRTLTLRAPAQRIVSLAPHVTELLYAAGAGTQLVGVSEYSDFPPEARALPRVAGSAGIELERVLALRPDLVVAWRFESNRAGLDRLEKLGVPVFHSEPRRLAQIAEQIEALGRLAGTEATATPAAARLQAGLAALQARYAGRAPLRVFYQIGDKPLMTLNGEHMVSSVLALCGASNVFAQAAGIASVVSLEAVAAADPDVIATGRTGGVDTAWQAAWKQRLPSLRAVRESRFATADADRLHRQGPRILSGAEALCAQLDRLRDRAR